MLPRARALSFLKSSSFSAMICLRTHSIRSGTESPLTLLARETAQPLNVQRSRLCVVAACVVDTRTGISATTPNGVASPSHLGSERDSFLGVVRSTSLVLHRLDPPIADVHVLPSKRCEHREEQGTLATTNVYPLSAKQASVDRPGAWPEHYQTQAQRREQEVNKHSVSGRKDYA